MFKMVAHFKDAENIVFFNSGINGPIEHVQ